MPMVRQNNQGGHSERIMAVCFVKGTLQDLAGRFISKHRLAPSSHHGHEIPLTEAVHRCGMCDMNSLSELIGGGVTPPHLIGGGVILPYLIGGDVTPPYRFGFICGGEKASERFPFHPLSAGA